MALVDHQEADAPLTIGVLTLKLARLQDVLLSELREELRRCSMISQLVSSPMANGKLTGSDSAAESFDCLAPLKTEFVDYPRSRYSLPSSIESELVCGEKYRAPAEPTASDFGRIKTPGFTIPQDNLPGTVFHDVNDASCSIFQDSTTADSISCGDDDRRRTTTSRRSIKITESLVRSARHAFVEREESQEELVSWESWRAVVLLRSSSEAFIAGTIVLNGIFIGVQTNYMAVSLSEDFPAWFFFADFVFFFIFFFEILLRIGFLRSRFFFAASWSWNIFDAVLVLLQLVELVATFFVGAQVKELATADSLKNLAFIRLLRVMRLMRTLRLARVLQFMGELNVVKEAIVATLRPLFGALLLLALMSYCMGIFFTQLVSLHRISAPPASIDERLPLYWGSLSRSTLSLFESCFGGVDWDDVAVPLSDINGFVMLLFIAFVAFVTIAMVNVITGIFVESAVSKADGAKVASLSKLLQKHIVEDDMLPGHGVGRWRFEEIFEDEKFRQQLFDFGINYGEAETLYDFLCGESERVEADQLRAGIMRLRTNAKFIDTLTLTNSIRSVQRRVEESKKTLSMMHSAVHSGVPTDVFLPSYPLCDEA
eukprot:TRINITY_DN9593_c0_g2_i1.p1 TRINITY_DN9593_c0_g2~~TRINITY_DN9593_c0_g2_i1.p1  ORF type:complete len:617 (+),score=69.83 TRINITY_DN9593_c0_g2_i1:56-1852(+)